MLKPRSPVLASNGRRTDKKARNEEGGRVFQDCPENAHDNSKLSAPHFLPPATHWKCAAPFTANGTVVADFRE
jgi:hypothetical protein